LLTGMKKIGSQLFSSCPIHGGSGTNRKQFVVNPETNEWKCFSPGHDTGGSTLEFVMAMQNCNPHQAAAHIARWFATPGGTFSSQRQHTKPKEKAMSGGAPTHDAWLVEDRGEERDKFWHKVGSVWVHEDKEGYNMILPPGLSVSGKVVVRPRIPHKEDEDEKSNGKRKK
jgi:hypothetical protein